MTAIPYTAVWFIPGHWPKGSDHGYEDEAVVGVGLDTKLGKLEAKTAEGDQISVEGYDSKGEAVVNVLGKVVDKIPLP